MGSAGGETCRGRGGGGEEEEEVRGGGRGGGEKAEERAAAYVDMEVSYLSENLGTRRL